MEFRLDNLIVLYLRHKVNIIHLICVGLYHFPQKLIDLGDYLLTLHR